MIKERKYFYFYSKSGTRCLPQGEERLLSWRQEVVMTVSVFFKHLYRYQSESNELTHWLQSAKERLEFWSQQSLTVPQELETVRDHLNSFLVSYSWT